MDYDLSRQQQHLAIKAQALQTMSPLATLKRGYVIALPIKTKLFTNQRHLK